MRGTFLVLPFGTSKMAMLPKSCNFILFLNLFTGLSIRWYTPSFGARGSSSAADATAIGTTARSYAGTKGQVPEASRPPTRFETALGPTNLAVSQFVDLWRLFC